MNDYADPSITLGNLDRVATRINDFLAGPPTDQSLIAWQAIWLALLVGGCFGSFLVSWIVGLAVGTGIRLTRRLDSPMAGDRS